MLQWVLTICFLEKNNKSSQLSSPSSTLYTHTQTAQTCKWCRMIEKHNLGPHMHFNVLCYQHLTLLLSLFWLLVVYYCEQKVCYCITAGIAASADTNTSHSVICHMWSCRTKTSVSLFLFMDRLGRCIQYANTFLNIHKLFSVPQNVCINTAGACTNSRYVNIHSHVNDVCLL